jgi:uncharacterized membrane protein
MMTRFARRRVDDLSTPRRGRSFGIHYDPEQFGQFSEGIARFLGTARFLVLQTVMVFIWISANLVWGLNIGNVREGGWDPYPFILLNLAFSTQAAYAAPLILLAQNRQADRDRQQVERDREISARTQADTEYLARELAAVRLTLSDVVTLDELREVTEKLTDAIGRLDERLASLDAPASAAGPAGAAQDDSSGRRFDDPR